MARKYYFKFKTFQNHTCRVDIYDATFSGTATELSKDVAGSPGCPSDEPLIIEEDHSDNLLDNVRTKTGYINLIELTTGGLQDLFPQRNDSLEVYALLDVADNVSATDAAEDNVIFYGYVQAQSFDNDYLAYSSELSIPITSIMGVIQDQPITTTKNVVKDIFIESFSSYKYIVLPGLMYDKTEEDVDDLYNLHIMSSVLRPYNSDYNYGIKQDGDDEIPQPFTPLSKKEFVEKFCNIFRLIAHDVGNMLVFTRIGWNANYWRYHNNTDWDTSETNIGSGSTIIQFSSTFAFADKKNKISTVNSAKQVIMRWEEMELPQSVDFSLASYVGRLSGYTNLIGLDYKGYNIVIPTGRIWHNNDSLANKTIVVGDGEKEWLQIFNQSLGDLLFSCPLAFWGTANNIHLEINSGGVGNPVLHLAIKNGNGQYYNFDAHPSDPDPEYWIDTISKTNIQFTNQKADIPLWIYQPVNFYELEFYSNTSNYFDMGFKDIVVENTDELNKYLFSQGFGSKITVPLDPMSIDEIEMNIDFIKYSSNAMSKPSVNYLGISQRNLTLHVRKKTSITELEMLICKMAMTNSDQNNRLISTRYDVRDDIFELQVMGNQYF